MLTKALQRLDDGGRTPADDAGTRREAGPSLEKPLGEDDPGRRQFCAVLLAGGVASLLQACGAGGGGVTGPSNVAALPVVSGTASGNIVSVAIAGTALASVGGAALVQSSLGLFLVAQTSTDMFVALDSTCTHQQCTVSGIAGQTYVCPCHGSQYSFTGQVQSGPAPRALRPHATTLQDGVLMIAK